MFVMDKALAKDPIWANAHQAIITMLESDAVQAVIRRAIQEDKGRPYEEIMDIDGNAETIANFEEALAAEILHLLPSKFRFLCCFLSGRPQSEPATDAGTAP